MASTDPASALARAERAAVELQQALADLRALVAQAPAHPDPIADGPESPTAVSERMCPAPEPAPPVVPAAILRLCDHLEATAVGLEQGRVGVDPALAAFLTRARPVLESAGGALASRLADVTMFVDRLAAAHPGTAYVPLHDAAAICRRLIADAAPVELGLVLPDPRLPECRTRLAPVPRPIPMSTGILLDGQHRQESICLVPDPAAHETSTMAWGILDDGWAALRTQHRASLAGDLASAFAQLCDGWATDPHRLRSLFNTITRHVEHASGPGMQAAAAYFKRLGWTPYAPMLGETWDPDRHDLVRHERIARSEGPAVITGIRQLGLLGADRLPIQKCIVITG